ncbi:GGDEF domain-containing protein [Butyrivibrio sp. AE2032]|uniref:GGDEF domain-containing protein n=1 Tax=Butyrivibrio sp. AE2032 TaxID=1458463 RepID=UPI0005557AEA|nr:GGDEF domain-containing protein [Butyrivibrio sp. AE2032]
MGSAEEKKHSNKIYAERLGNMFSFLVGNAYSFTAGVMGLVHFVLLITFWLSGVMPLVQFNVLSVVVYIFCFILCRTGHLLPVYASIILEVTAYTVVSSYYVGLKCGTYCFLFSIIPIIIYFGSSLFKGLQRWGVVLMLILNFLTFTVLYISFSNVPPVYEVSETARVFLVIFSAFAMVFAILFYNAMYIYASEHEVTILQQKNRELSADAKEDALTKLLNRRGFLPMVKELMNNRRGKRFCIAFCDLDDFKRVNDTYGHEAGDEVLKHITRIITDELHGCDICRWGGEEIVILMRDYDLDTARVKLETLRKNIASDPTIFFNKEILVTITLGVAENKNSYKEPEEIIKVADERMYYGKQHGKNILIYEDRQLEEKETGEGA